MQARLQLNSFPTLVWSVIFAVVAAMVLGATLAYVFKPPTLVPGRTQVIVVHDTAGISSESYSCVWLDGHKSC